MTALIVVDVQNDFLKNGALAVPFGNDVIPAINEWAKNGSYDLIVATQDWHPENHLSFASNHNGGNVFDIITLNGKPQVLWPNHCVQGTYGAEFHKELDVKFDAIFQKGKNPQFDSYSGFFDNNMESTGLNEFLIARCVTNVHVVGLATDYCVAATAKHANELGYITTIITDACRGVNMNANDSDKILAELNEDGVFLL